MTILGRVNPFVDDPPPTQPPSPRPQTFARFDPAKRDAVNAWEAYDRDVRAWYARHPEHLPPEVRAREAARQAEQERAARAAAEHEAERQRELAERDRDPACCELSPLDGDADAIARVLSSAELTAAGDRSQRACPVCAGVFVFERRGDKVEARCMAGCPNTAVDAAIIGAVREAEAQLEAEAEAQLEAEAEAKRAAHAASLKPKVRAKRGEQWLIHNVLGRGLKQLVVAPAFGFKSLLEYSKAIAIAAGVPWLGRATRRGPVMIVALDGTAGDDHLRRLRGLAAGMGVDFDRLVDEGWLLFYDPVDDDGDPEPLRLDDPDRVAQLFESIDACNPPPVFFLLDNLTRARSQRTIGAGNDMLITDELWQPIEDLAARGITTSVLHHANKRGGVMGSEASSAAADVEIHLDHEGKSPHAWVTITGVARNPCQTNMVVRFLGGVDSNGVADGSPIQVEERIAKHAEPESAKTEDDARAALLSVLPATAEQIYERMAERGFKYRNAVLSLRKQLEADGLIKLVDKLWQGVPDDTE